MKKIEIVLRQTEQNIVSESVLASFENLEAPLVERSASKSITFPGLTISLNEQLVYRDNEVIRLTSKEFCTLVFLAQYSQWVHSAEHIYEAVWRESGDHCGNAVSKIICQLRRKLTPDTPHSGYIHTVPGHGYKFVIPDE